MGRLFESPSQRAFREAADKSSDLIRGLLSDVEKQSIDVTGKLSLLADIERKEKEDVMNRVSEYLASQGVPLGSIRAVNIANALIPMSIERMRQELGILNLADQFNLQKLGMKHSLANSLANLYLAKAQGGYSQYSPFDVSLAFLNTLANIGRSALGFFGK